MKGGRLCVWGGQESSEEDHRAPLTKKMLRQRSFGVDIVEFGLKGREK